MRLAILDEGHRLRTRVLLALIRILSRQQVLDVVKLVSYRPEFYGQAMQRVAQIAMRGPSGWSVAERELMAAFIAQANTCAFCIGAHTAVAQRAYGADRPVAAWLADLDSAPIGEPLRAVLRMLTKLTREQSVGAGDMRAVLATGISREQIEEALNVAYAFNVMTRLAEAFGFAVPDAGAFEAGARYLLARGYR